MLVWVSGYETKRGDEREDESSTRVVLFSKVIPRYKNPVCVCCKVEKVSDKTASNKRQANHEVVRTLKDCCTPRTQLEDGQGYDRCCTVCCSRASVERQKARLLVCVTDDEQTHAVSMAPCQLFVLTPKPNTTL